jgi:hypothetical protein
MALTHKRIITVDDDATQPEKVQPSDWNDDHVLSGGTDGQVLVADAAQETGFRWDDAPSLVIGGLAWTVTFGANDSAGAGYRTVTFKAPNTA